MGTHGYIISQLMLEEHRQNVERASPNPDSPGAEPVRRSAAFAPFRQRASIILRSLADRLDASEHRFPASQTTSAD